jgi:hypothetical protein
MHNYDLGIFEPSGQLFHFWWFKRRKYPKGEAPSEREGYQPRKPSPYPHTYLGMLADLRV